MWNTGAELKDATNLIDQWRAESKLPFTNHQYQIFTYKFEFHTQLYKNTLFFENLAEIHNWYSMSLVRSNSNGTNAKSRYPVFLCKANPYHK